MKSLKLMILGVCFVLFGGILVLDTSTNIGGFELYIVLLGVILSIIGFLKSDN